MQDINLLQSKIKDREESWQRNNRTANIILFLVLLVVAGVGGLFWFLDSGSASKLAQIQSDTVRLQSEIDSQDETLKTATDYQAQLKNLKLVLDNHVAWTVLLEELAAYTLTGASYSSMQGSLTQAVHVEGVTQTYNQLAKLVLGLSTSENIESVELLSTSPSSGEITAVNFSIDITPSANLFAPR